MLKKLKLLALSFSSLIMFSLPFAAATVSAAPPTDFDQTNINQNLCNGSNGVLTPDATTNCTADGSTANNLVKEVVNVLSVIVGVVAVIMIIVAGLRYITSGGKQESVTGAKNTIMYAVIGLVIVALAQLIVHFVLSKTTTATTP
jgi:cytochrome bd-type quinol oxidase subunit 2